MKEKKDVKETRKFNINKHNDILDTLLEFLTKENSLSNDVLCGYFNKVLIFLMANYPMLYFYIFLW